MVGGGKPQEVGEGVRVVRVGVWRQLEGGTCTAREGKKKKKSGVIDEAAGCSNRTI